MAPKKSYSRYFIILQEDEKGFSLEKDKSPSGYVKLEKKNDKCKVSYYAQNLNLEKQPYHLVLICNKKDVKTIVKLSKATMDEHGKLDISHEYEANNVAAANIGVDKILGAAIVKMIDNSIISIMSGFTASEAPSDWKAYPLMGDKREEKQPEEEMFKKYEEKIEESKNEERIEKEETRQEETSEKAKDEEQNEESDMNEQTRKKHKKYDYDDMDYEEEKKKEMKEDEDDYPIGMVGDFFKSLVGGFKREENITKELKYCQWYKVDVNSIEDLYDMSDYDRYAVVYYPMLAYYAYLQKYNHFGVGLKCNEKGKLQYLIYAIPGDKTKEEQPFGGKTGYVTWVSTSDRPNKGYWLMFYDMRHSCVVVPVKKK